ncbi:MAG: KH domain-containing protein [Candidatus Woesearchaeota archaeon]
MKSPPKNQENEETSEEFLYEIKVPKDRIAVVIGSKGEIKKRFEEFVGCSINIDSQEGIVTLKGNDSLKLYCLQSIIKAIARGFNPEIAQLLLKQDYCLEVVSLNEYNAKKNHQLRLKGRVIGEKGKSRRAIEELTGSFVSVYGKTISIIGTVEEVLTAKKAIEFLLAGSRHATVYKWLEKQRRLALQGEHKI